MPATQIEPRYVWTYSLDGRQIKKYNVPKGQPMNLQTFARALAKRDVKLRSGHVEYVQFDTRPAPNEERGSNGRGIARSASGGRRLISGRKREREELAAAAATKDEDMEELLDLEDDRPRSKSGPKLKDKGRKALARSEDIANETNDVEEEKEEEDPQMTELRKRIDELEAKKLNLVMDLKQVLRVDDMQKQRQRIQQQQQQMYQQQQQQAALMSPRFGAQGFQTRLRSLHRCL